MLRRVVAYKQIDVSEVPAATVIYCDEGGGRHLGNVGVFLEKTQRCIIEGCSSYLSREHLKFQNVTFRLDCLRYAFNMRCTVMKRRGTSGRCHVLTAVKSHHFKAPYCVCCGLLLPGRYSGIPVPPPINSRF